MPQMLLLLLLLLLLQLTCCRLLGENGVAAAIVVAASSAHFYLKLNWTNFCPGSGIRQQATTMEPICTKSARRTKHHHHPFRHCSTATPSEF